MFRFLLLLLPLLPLTVRAEETDSDPDFLVRIWQSEEGLPGNVVRSIGQTHDNFLWVATAEGIARFDGIDFELVEPAADSRGRRINLFRLFTVPSGGVWVSTFQGGLLRIRDMELVRILADEQTPQNPLITQLVEVNGSVRFKRGEVIWESDGTSAHPISEPDAPTLEAFAADLEHQGDGGRWIVQDTSPVLIDRRQGRWTVENRNRLYFEAPGEDRRLVRIAGVDGRVLINEMFEDREGNIWLASPVEGLIRLRHSRIARIGTVQGLHERSVLTAIQTRDGAWWIANRSGGVDRIADGVSTHMDVVPGGYHRPIISLFEDSRSRLWLGSRDGTLFQWTGTGFIRPHNEFQSLSKVAAITEDRRGRLWFGGGQGLARLDGETVESFEEIELLAEIEVSTLATAADDTVLIGTTDGQLLVADDSGFTHLGKRGVFNRRWITSILPLAENEVWVTTIGAGLFLWRDGTWHSFDQQEGLPDNRLTTVVRSGDNDLWIGSLGGILRAQRSGLLLHATNPDLPIRWLRLDRSDGLLTRECVGGTQPGAWKAADGTIWFPTGSGLAGVRPDRINLSITPPTVHLRPVRIDGHPASGNPVIAGPGRVRFDFAFTGLSLSAPEKVSYLTRLVGLENSRRAIGGQRTASYESVPPGKYRFEVTAVNGDGIQGLQPASIDIVVRPHFWQTAWFISLAIVSALLLALGIGWAVARSRMKARFQELKLRSALQSERARISRDLHDDLGASLTELSILSALSAETPDDSTLRPSLGNLSLKAKSVVGTLDEIVWAANPREDSLRSLVDYLAAFAREFLANAGITLRTEIERRIPEIPIGPNRRHNVFLAARETVNNAVKHAAATEVRLQIAIENGTLVIRIRDNGRGFNIEYAASGNGLSNLRKRMADCGGDCVIASKPGEGSTVTLTLPLPPLPSAGN